MKVSFKQAKVLNPSLSPLLSYDLKWLDMLEIKQITPTLKYETAVTIQENWFKDRKEKRTEAKRKLKGESILKKLLLLLILIIISGVIISGFLNLPPLSYLTDAYCYLFDTDHYYPMLNITLLLIPLAFIYKRINDRMK
ncbi:MAG: hypothetical protein ACKOXB_08370 [Flavobacteriales bacterium]